MYHCLTGTLPFEGEPRAGVIYKTAFEDPTPLRTRAPEDARSHRRSKPWCSRRWRAGPRTGFHRCARCSRRSIFPEDPTAPRALVAACRTPAGQSDSTTTQVREPQEKRPTTAADLAKGSGSPSLAAFCAKLSPSALHTLAEPAAEMKQPAAWRNLTSSIE